MTHFEHKDQEEEQESNPESLESSEMSEMANIGQVKTQQLVEKSQKEPSEHHSQEHTTVSGNHHHQNKHNKDYFWKIATTILAIIVVFSVFNNGFSFGQGLSQEQAADKAMTFINTQLLSGGSKAILNSVKEEGGLYLMNINVGGQNTDVYILKDGTKLFPQGIDLEANPTAPQNTNTATTKTKVDPATLADDDAVRGDKNTPLTIVEFSDYQCPYCAKFYQQTLPSIEEQYIKTGKVKLIYRDFPLDIHENAQKAAEAAECAGEQNKYYEMHDKLFESGVAGGITSFKQYAKEIGLDTAKFNQCLDSGAMVGEVQKDLSDGKQLGVSGTPAFFINGQMLTGAQPFSTFQQVIEQELAKIN